jgi:hypothetical protein
MFTYFDPRSIVSRFLANSGCSIAALARLQVDTHYSKFMLERILRGEKQVSDYEGKQLVQLVRDLEEIQGSSPAKLNFSDTDSIRPLLQSRRSDVDTHSDWLAGKLEVEA